MGPVTSPIFRLGKEPRVRGFTLIELLAVVATTGLLAVLCVGATQKALDSAAKAREIGAARHLVTALLSSTQDNNGAFLPAVDYRAGKPETPVYKPDGGLVTGQPAHRYPYRLGPYLGNQFDGTIFVNRNKKEIIKKTGGSGSNYDYQVSTFPALGINAYCVGGVVTATGDVQNSADCISHSANLRGTILAFASGGSGVGNGRTHGYHYVFPPTMAPGGAIPAAPWSNASSWSADKDPVNYGWVDFRYDEKAVCAFLDGSVRMCSVEELSDMRLWSRSALEANDPNFPLTP